MVKVILYLLFGFVLLLFLLLVENFMNMPQWYLKNIIFTKCSFIGGIGGILYCIRAVYINKCVQKTWDDVWLVWYFLRPFASIISGFVCCLFLKAGLLILDASTKQANNTYGYLAIAFIAGYNVDNFMKKIESIAQSVWGISKSRASSETQDNNG